MEQLREKLVLENIGYAKALARRFCPEAKGADRQDIESAALEGLTIAAVEFDPDRDVSFTTYAAWWIRKKVYMEIEFLSENGKGLGEHQDYREDVFNELVRTIEVDKLNSAIRQLDDKEQYIIDHYYMYGLAMKGVAKDLGEPLATVFWRKDVALKKLRGILK